MTELMMTRLLPQYGVGIELRGDALLAIYSRRTWGRFRVVDRLEIGGLQERGAAECGRLYREFLRTHGLHAPWTVVALPREMVLLRELKFPQTVASELRAAIELQLDGLHPFEEGSVVWDYQRRADLPDLSRVVSQAASARGRDGLSVQVAIASRAKIEELTEWFRQAQIPISQFAVSPALLDLAGEHVFWSEPAPAASYVVLYAGPGAVEMVGRSPAGAAASREVRTVERAGERVGEGTGEPEWKVDAASLERELANLRSELRLEPSALVNLLVCGPAKSSAEGVLNAAAIPAQGFQMVRAAQERLGNSETAHEDLLGIAAAMAAVDRPAHRGINLLPPERRQFEARGAQAASYGLAAAVVLLGAGLALRGTVQDWQYSRQLDVEMSGLRPRIAELEALRDRAGADYRKLLRLEAIRSSTRMPLEVLDEIARLLPPDAWMQLFQMESSAVTITGTAASASAVLQAVSGAARLESTQFLSGITRSSDGKEGFRIGARLRAGGQ